MLADFSRNLRIRELVSRFNAHDPFSQGFTFQPFYKLTLGLPWPKDLDRICVPDMPNDGIIVSPQVVCVFSASCDPEDLELPEYWASTSMSE
jgi:hypothetical protein